MSIYLDNLEADLAARISKLGPTDSSELANQLSALRLARQDQADADFLEKNGAEIRAEWDDGEAPLPCPEFSVWVKGTGTIATGKTQREAIRAARAI